MKLLIVDDQEEVGAIVGRIAQQNGWDCVHMVKADGVPGVVSSQKVDVMLLDYMIDRDPNSRRTGLTVVEELRSHGQKLPVILFTGWPEQVDMDVAAQLDVLKVLAKPLSIVELRQSLAEARRKCANEPAA